MASRDNTFSDNEQGRKRMEDDTIKQRHMRTEVFFKVTQKLVQKYTRIIRKTSNSSSSSSSSTSNSSPLSSPTPSPSLEASEPSPGHDTPLEEPQQVLDNELGLLETLKEGFEKLLILVNETQRKLEDTPAAAPRALRAQVRTYIKNNQQWLKLDPDDINSSGPSVETASPSPDQKKHQPDSSSSSSSSSISEDSQLRDARPRGKSTLKKRLSHIFVGPGHGGSEGSLAVGQKSPKGQKSPRTLGSSSPSVSLISQDQSGHADQEGHKPKIQTHAQSMVELPMFAHSPPSFAAPSAPLDTPSVVSILPEIFDIVPKQISYFQAFKLPESRKMKPPKPIDSESLTAEQQMLAKRELVFDELVTTEIAYARSLGTLVAYYVKPLQSDCAFAPDRKVRNTFVNIEEVFNVTKCLVEDLLLIENLTGPDQPVGELFNKREREIYSIYSTFCSLKNSSEKALIELKNDTKTFAFLSHAATLEHSASVESLLIQPFQRIVRYKLLLEQLLKFTEPSWPDFSNLQMAINVLQNILFETNKLTGSNDNMVRIKQLCSKINGFKPRERYHLVYLFDGPCRELGSFRTKKRHLFLLNELLIVTEPKHDDTFDVVGEPIPIESIKIVENVNSDEITFFLNSDKITFRFQDSGQTQKWYSELSSAVQKRILSLK